MTLQQLRYFIEITEQGSMNRAAERLFIAQPSLSKAIKDLEAELSIDLFTRTPRGVILTAEGIEFLGYARQVIEQTSLLEQRYLDKKPPKGLLSVSTQHYAFAVNAFVETVRKSNADEYDFTLRETRTHEIIDDVAHLRSEVGILYRNPFNGKVLDKILDENALTFHPLFKAAPHVFISTTNPLAGRERVTLSDLADFPYLSFEQGENNSFYFSEEILSTVIHRKSIHVSDRATLFNLLIGLDGYTISTGVFSEDLNGDNIISVPLHVKDHFHVGWIAHRSINLTRQATLFIDELEKVLQDQGIPLEKQ